MALVMRYYSDMSYDEIADELGVRRALRGRSAAGVPGTSCGRHWKATRRWPRGGAFMNEIPEGKMKHLDEMTLLLYIERQLGPGARGWKFPRTRKNATFAVRCCERWSANRGC